MLTFVVSVHLPTVASVKAAYMIAIKTKKRLPPLQIETEIICHVACTWVSAEVTVVYATKRGWRLGREVSGDTIGRLIGRGQQFG